MTRLAFALLCALCATATFADTLYVTPAGAGAKNGSSWANAFAGIQAAVDAADAAYAADGTLHDILVLPHRHRRAAFFRRACPTGDSEIINGWPP